MSCNLGLKLSGIFAAAILTIALNGAAHPASAYDGMARNWTGFYVGAGGGAGAINHELDVDIPAIPANFTFDGIGGEGVFGTVQVGADAQVSRTIVVGVFFDYDFSGIETDASLGAPGFSASGEIPVDSMWTLGGRIGVLSAPSTLWYIGAGYSKLNMGDASGSVTIGGDPPLSGSYGLPSFTGYSLLAGVETLLWGDLSLKLEYRFSQFDRESLFSIPDTVDIGLEPSMHTARLVGSYRFNFDQRRSETLK